MEDEYGMGDLGHYISGRPIFPTPPPQDLLSSRRALNPYHDMLVFRSDNNTTITSIPNNAAAAASCGGFRVVDGGGGDGGTGRWPRQETLTLLEIRSKLDFKFKEANQKGPLWDEVSRIMREEHGYQRSGKKCREKFENLYKYYKKTKEGKAGRQDGKHYRFFRHLEALYSTESSHSASVSETHYNILGASQQNFPTSSPNNYNNNQESKFSDTTSFSCDSDDTSSSKDNGIVGNDENDSKKKKIKRRGKKSWKVKIGDFLDAQMKKLMDKQEAWMERMMRTIEEKERERMLREEEWRKQDAARIEREHKLWASERAWIEARDAALMDTLHKMAGKEMKASPPEEVMIADIRSLSENQNDDGSETMTYSFKDDMWAESEISALVQLRSGMDLKFQQSGISEEVLWEEIAAKMAYFGHDRSGVMCREKWGNVNNYLLKCNKKRKENSSGCNYNQNNESVCNQGGGSYCDNSELNHHDQVNSPPPENTNNNTGNALSDSCFRYFMGDVYGRIMH